MKNNWISIDEFSKLVYSGYEKVYSLFKSIYLPIKDTVSLKKGIPLSEAIRKVSVTPYSTRVKIEFNTKYLKRFINWTERYANGQYKLCLKQKSDNEHQWISIAKIIKHQNLSRTYTYRYIDILRENETIFEQPNANVISERPYGGGTAFYINQEYLQQFLSAVNSFIEQKNSEKAQKKQHKLKKLISLRQIKEQHPELSQKTIKTVAENLASSNPEIITVKNTPKRGKTLYINQEHLQQFLSAVSSFIEQKNSEKAQKKQHKLKKLISLTKIKSLYPELSPKTIQTVAKNLASSNPKIIFTKCTPKRGETLYVKSKFLEQFLSAVNSFIEQKNSEKQNKSQLISLRQIKEQHPEISRTTIKTVAENLASSNPEIITVKNTPKRGKTLYINQEHLQQFLSAINSFVEQKNKQLISLSQIQKQHPEISRTTIKTVAENLASPDSEIITVRNTSKGGKQLYVKSEFLEQFLLKVHSNTPQWIPFNIFCKYINQTPKRVFNNFDHYITATNETLSTGNPITDVIQVSKKRIKYQIDKRFMREFVEWTKEYEKGRYKLTLKNRTMLTNLSNNDAPLFKRIQDYDWNSHTDTFWKEIICIHRGKVYIKTKYMNILNALSTTPDNEKFTPPEALRMALSMYTTNRTK